MPPERPLRLLPVVIAAVVALCVFSLAAATTAPTLSVHENVFVDFRINVWEPGRLLLNGESPLLTETDEGETGTVYPPSSVVATLPFALPPYGIAAVLWFCVLVACVLCALRLCGVRDWRCLALALASPPVVAGLAYGNLSLVLVLALAAVWVWRDEHWRAGGVLGLVIAAKLFLWPLVVWMLITRRHRAAAITAAATGLASLIGWAAVGFRRIGDFPDVLRQNTAEYLDEGLSVAAMLANLGTSASVAAALAAVVAMCAVGVAWLRRDDDLACFTWVLVAALLLSPIVWGHYYALLLVPLAVTSPTLSRAWLLPYLTIPQLSPSVPGAGKLVDAASGVLFALLAALRCDARRRPAEFMQSPAVSPAVGEVTV